MWIVSVLVLILILGIIILVHEFGHFIWAKKCGVHIYEFSIGMGPIIYTHKGKDKINYNIRALPIGGFVAMAGEIYEDDDTKKIKKEKFLCNRPWYQRLIILVAGVLNNFILAILLLFLISLIWGGDTGVPYVDKVIENYPAEAAGMQAGDKITAVNNHKVKSWDVAQIYTLMKNKNSYTTFEVEHKDGTTEKIKVTPIKEKDEEGNERLVYGIQIGSEDLKGFLGSIKYSFVKFRSIITSMWITIGGLLTGKISLDALSGPVGMYQVIDQSMAYGISQLIYITAFLSINVGFINILPVPAFDGGHVLFLIIEKIKRSPINQKLETTINNIFFILLLLLMAYITVKDIIKLF